MSNIAINFKHVTKTYSISRYKYGRLSEDLSHLFQRLILKQEKTLQKEKLFAIRDVSFKITQGTTLGIIGKNGSGKTTILKLISRITYPDAGEIRVNGKIGAFIELGAGLHPELTGRENIYLYGSIIGMKKSEIEEKYGNIVKFSGIEKFIDTPIKRYSSGMYARLGFSVIAFMEPEILLIDEVLAVGDKNFQEKCLEKMREFTKSNKAIIFVSHNMDAIKSVCSRVIYLENGKIKKTGKSRDVIDYYIQRTSETNL